jgi:hypothetical protein
MICDVCRNPDVTVHVVAPPSRQSSLLSTTDVIVEDDDGNWFVCDSCAALVEARDVPALLARAADAAPPHVRSDPIR